VATGRINELNNGKYKVTIELGRDENGKKVRRHKTCTGKREAQRALASMLGDAGAGKLGQRTTMKVEEYLLWWLPRHAKMKKLKDKTVEGYDYYIKTYINPHIGHFQLEKLETKDIEDWLLELGENYTRSVELSFVIVRMALEQAVKKYKHLKYSPADALDTPTYKKRKARTLNPKELETYLKVAKKHPEFPPIATLLFTGLRRGEVIALAKDNINLEEGTFTIIEAAQRIKGKGIVTDDTKTEAGERTFFIPAALIPVLEQVAVQQEKNKEAKKEHKRRRDTNYVFTTEYGRQLDPSKLSRRFHEIAVEAGFPDFKLHDARHTFISLMRDLGVRLEVIQSIVGHKQASSSASSVDKQAADTVTLKTYTHVYQEAKLKAAEIFSDRFGHLLGTCGGSTETRNP
jgi:integrase